MFHLVGRVSLPFLFSNLLRDSADLYQHNLITGSPSVQVSVCWSIMGIP